MRQGVHCSLDIHKSMRSDGIDPKVPRELVCVTQCHCKGTLSSLKGHGDWGRFSMIRKGKHHNLYEGQKKI